MRALVRKLLESVKQKRAGGLLLTAPWMKPLGYRSSLSDPSRDGLERLARDLLRAPVSLERLHVDEQAHAIAYAARSKPSHGARAPTRLLTPRTSSPAP